MKSRATVIFAVSILFNIILGTLLYSSFKGNRNIKESLNETRTKYEEVTQKFNKQQEINDNLYTDYKLLKADKEKLTGKTKVLSSQNKNLSKQVKVLSSKVSKMNNRMIAGKKSSSYKKGTKNKYTKKYKKTNRYKRCR